MIKKKKNLIIAIVMLAAICYFPILSARAEADPPKLVGYLPDYRSTAAYTAMDYSKLTHLNIAFCNPDQNGSLSHGFESDLVLKRIIQQAHAQGVKVLAVLGSDKGYAHLTKLTSAGSYQAFNAKIMSFLQQYDFDGIDLDIERNAPDDFWGNYEFWARDLKSRLQQENMLLTAAVATSFSHKITDQTFSCFDFINVMAYDDDSSAGHATYEFAFNMLKHLAEKRKIPTKKLVLGIPSYGRSNDGVDSYQSILSKYPDAWKYDEIAGYNYNGITTVQWKAALGKKYGGIMLWELTQDSRQEHSLLTAAHDVLRGEVLTQTVAAGSTREIKSAETYTNKGIMIVDGVLKNNGRLINQGLIIVNGQIQNNGTITNDAKLINQGRILNGAITGKEAVLGMKAELTNLTVKPYTGTFDNKSHHAVQVRGLRTGDLVYYKVNQGAYLRTIPTVKEVKDSCQITVKVVRNANYNEWQSKTIRAAVKNLVINKVAAVSAKANTTKKITIKFRQISNAHGYEIYRSTQKLKAYKRVKVLTGKTRTAFADARLTGGITYYYRIRAYQTINGKKVYGSFSDVKAATTYLTAVQIKKPVLRTKALKKRTVQRNVLLRWAKTKNAQGYVIYRSQNKTRSYRKLAVMKSGTKVTYTDKKILKGKKYYYKIRAYKRVAGKTLYGSFSRIGSVAVKY